MFGRSHTLFITFVSVAAIFTGTLFLSDRRRAHQEFLREHYEYRSLEKLRRTQFRESSVPPPEAEFSATLPLWIGLALSLIAAVYFAQQRESEKLRAYANILVKTLRKNLRLHAKIAKTADLASLPDAERIKLVYALSKENRNASNAIENASRFFCLSECRQSFCREKITLSRLAERVIPRAEVLFEDAGTDIEIILEKELRERFICTVPGLVEHIVFNLADNVVKHAFSREDIFSVEFFEHGKMLSIRFSDAGPGLSEKAKKHLFRPFVPATDPGAASGQGLGLAVSRMVARELGGDLILEKTDSSGTSFLLQLPL